MADYEDKNVCIINYGAGNIQSVYNIFKQIVPEVKVSNTPCDIERATHLVLPGVGAFGVAMEKIKSLEAFDSLEDAVLVRKKPFLGICVGMQILADEGREHGVNEGLGWIGGIVKKLDSGDLCLPHVGWNDFKMRNEKNSLLKNIPLETDFYYVHSFYFDNLDKEYVGATCEYGMEFTSLINKENIYGVQFHPEKSQKAGKKLLENFLEV